VGLAVEVDTSLTGERVVRVLERLRDQRGVPQRCAAGDTNR